MGLWKLITSLDFKERCWTSGKSHKSLKASLVGQEIQASFCNRQTDPWSLGRYCWTKPPFPLCQAQPMMAWPFKWHKILVKKTGQAIAYSWIAPPNPASQEWIHRMGIYQSIQWFLKIFFRGSWLGFISRALRSSQPVLDSSPSLRQPHSKQSFSPILAPRSPRGHFKSREPLWVPLERRLLVGWVGWDDLAGAKLSTEKGEARCLRAPAEPGRGSGCLPS